MSNLVRVKTALGHFCAYFSEAGLLALTCPYPSPARALRQLLAMLPSGMPLAAGRPRSELRRRLAHYLSAYALREATGPPAVALDGRGLSEFDKRVFSALWRVPFGSVVTYGTLAAACDARGAARAAGQAVGRNRWCVLIPCHRVVAAGGGLGGFGAGLQMKRMLLRHEGLDPSALHPAKFPPVLHKGGPQWCAGSSEC